MEHIHKGSLFSHREHGMMAYVRIEMDLEIIAVQNNQIQKDNNYIYSIISKTYGCVYVYDITRLDERGREIRKKVGNGNMYV